MKTSAVDALKALPGSMGASYSELKAILVEADDSFQTAWNQYKRRLSNMDVRSARYVRTNEQHKQRMGM